MLWTLLVAISSFGAYLFAGIVGAVLAVANASLWYRVAKLVTKQISSYSELDRISVSDGLSLQLGFVRSDTHGVPLR